MHLNTDPYAEASNPEEEAALRRFVAITTVTCPRVAIQTAVTTAAIALGQDWRQEARVVLLELGLSLGYETPMHASSY